MKPASNITPAFFSNLYLGGFPRDYGSIGHDYDRLSSNHGVNVVHGWASAVDGANKTLNLASGAKLPYDKLVLSPGIDLKYDSIPGYSAAAQTRMPHAWKSGTQVKVLRDQVMNMKKAAPLSCCRRQTRIVARPACMSVCR